MSYRDEGTTERGLSSVIALVLLLGLVAIGSIGILLAGGTATDQTQEQTEEKRIELAFRQLDSQMDHVGREEASSKTVDVDLGDEQGGAVREQNTGHISITRTNVTSGSTDLLVDRSLGSIVYEDGGEEYAIQSGAVWRGTGNQTQMISAPPISYASTKAETEPTLTVPLIEATGDRQLVDDTVRITHNATVSPLNDVSVVEGDLITVRIRSPYYVGWGKYFAQITNDEAVTYEHANQTAVVQMIVPSVAPPVEGGVIMGAAADTLKFKQQATVDSYNSTADPYSISQSQNTRVISAGDVELQQDATVEGSLEVAGDVRFKQNAIVQGNFQYEDTSTIDYHSSPNSHVTGWRADNASVADRTPVDGVIDRNVLLVRDNNVNDSTSTVVDGELQGCDSGGGCTLPSGAYYLDEIDLDDTDRLVLDATSGPVNLVVMGSVSLSDSASIEVVGSGRVGIYVDSETGSEDFSMKQDSAVTVPGDRAPQLWVYMDSDGEVKFRQSADFTGVVYGPGPGTSTGTEIRMSSTTDEIHVYGAVVGDVEPITQEVQVHYDEALATETPVTTATAVPRLTFLHVSVYQVDVENAE